MTAYALRASDINDVKASEPSPRFGLLSPPLRGVSLLVALGSKFFIFISRNFSCQVWTFSVIR
ncbi:MAG: hypothetical protein V2G51_03130 [bacterium JZ-2024 1]